MEQAKESSGKLHQNCSVSRNILARAETYAGRQTQSSLRLQAPEGECSVNTAGERQLKLARIEVNNNGLNRFINEIDERYNCSTSAIIVSSSDVVTNKNSKENSFDVVADFYNLDVEDLKLDLSKNLEMPQIPIWHNYSLTNCLANAIQWLTCVTASILESSAYSGIYSSDFLFSRKIVSLFEEDKIFYRNFIYD